MKELKSAVQSLADIATGIWNGDSIVAGKSLSERRIEICKECPSFSGYKCVECGCFMIAKTKINSATCPKGHWDSKMLEKALTDQIGSFEDPKCCK